MVTKLYKFNFDELDGSFRLNSSHHHSYDFVEASHIDFSTRLNWRHELDEMIRLIGEEGYLSVRCGQSLELNILNVKNFLGRRLGIEATIENENPRWAKKIINNEKWSKEDYVTKTIFKIKRKNLEIYQDKKWTFAVLTIGNKVAEVVKFCKSIRDLDPFNVHEILICGPKNEEYNKFNVNYLKNPRQYREEYSEVCAKKNDIIAEAKNQNLMICHDRYYLTDNFFEGFEKYGYDFDFLSVDTIFEDSGERFPHYVKMGYIKHDFKWHKEWFCFKNANYYKENALSQVFVNGGLAIFKRDVVKQIGYNECFFWHQVEDVEISKEFIKHNILPRCNLYSKLITSKKSSDNIGVNLELSYEANKGSIRLKSKKLNFYKRIRRGFFKILYHAITNKKLLSYLESIVFKL